MDYKTALVATRKVLPPTGSKPSLFATQTEHDEIIKELQMQQSRPHLITARVDTTEVNTKINELFYNNQGYYTKTEIALSIDTLPARQWFLDAIKEAKPFQEARQFLHTCIAETDIPKLKKILEWTATDASGNSCLVRYNNKQPLAHLTYFNPDMLELVLAAGANPDARDEYNVTPLHRAAYEGNSTSVKILLSAGAHPNVVAVNPENPMLETPLLCAIDGFCASEHPDDKYTFFKIAAFLVCNHFGNGGCAYRTMRNSKGLSPKAIGEKMHDSSKEGLKLKQYLTQATPPRSW